MEPHDALKRFRKEMKISQRDVATQLGMLPQAYYRYESGQYLLPTASLLQLAKNFNVTTGAISSADWWMDWVDYVSFLHETYGVTCTEMETASAAQICHNAGVPFIGIRVISDNVSGNEEYSFDPADTCQNFVLLVTESYIRDVLKK